MESIPTNASVTDDEKYDDHMNASHEKEYNDTLSEKETVSRNSPNVIENNSTWSSMNSHQIVETEFKEQNVTDDLCGSAMTMTLSKKQGTAVNSEMNDTTKHIALSRRKMNKPKRFFQTSDNSEMNEKQTDEDVDSQETCTAHFPYFKTSHENLLNKHLDTEVDPHINVSYGENDAGDYVQNLDGENISSDQSTETSTRQCGQRKCYQKGISSLDGQVTEKFSVNLFSTKQQSDTFTSVMPIPYVSRLMKSHHKRKNFVPERSREGCSLKSYGIDNEDCSRDLTGKEFEENKVQRGLLIKSEIVSRDLTMQSFKKLQSTNTARIYNDNSDLDFTMNVPNAEGFTKMYRRENESVYKNSPLGPSDEEFSKTSSLNMAFSVDSSDQDSFTNNEINYEDIYSAIAMRQAKLRMTDVPKVNNDFAMNLSYQEDTNLPDISSDSEISKGNCDEIESEDLISEMSFSKRATKKVKRSKSNIRRSYYCEICKRGFAHSTHKRIHTGERPYKCDICGQQFMKSYNLNSHVRIHTGVKPFQCDICFKEFSHSSTFNSHKLTHSGEKPFPCEFCDKTFAKSSNLNRHKQSVHMGERPYGCKWCERQFSSKKHLNRHIVLQHGDLSKEDAFKELAGEQSNSNQLNASLEPLVLHGQEQSKEVTNQQEMHRSFTTEYSESGITNLHQINRDFTIGSSEDESVSQINKEFTMEHKQQISESS